MSEKVFRLLLHLYPSHFRQEYGDEALQLFRDRTHDEAGVWPSVRLWFDLLTDLVISLPREYCYTRPEVARALGKTCLEGTPIFFVFDTASPGWRPVLLGGLLSLITLVSFPRLMNEVSNFRPPSGWSYASPGPYERQSQNVAEPKPEDATRAMIRLFDHHDIVMFGEIHSSKQEYEWLCKLVKTPGFSDHVDDIVVEFGNALYQQDVDRYVAGNDVPFEQVRKAWRNMIVSVPPVSPVYGWFYQAVRDANLQRPGSHRIRLLMGSPPGDWDKIKAAQDLSPYEAQRAQWYLHVVKDEVLAQHHRALLIMGAGHFLRGSDQALQDELLEQQHKPVPPLDRGRLAPGDIERELRAADANPYLVVMGTNVIDSRGDLDPRIEAWPTPVLIPVHGNWLGDMPSQPIVSGGHAPPTPLTLADQTDAMVYIAPCSALKSVDDSPAELDGTAYGKEMIRRNIIEVGHPLPFQYGESPECVQATHDASNPPTSDVSHHH